MSAVVHIKRKLRDERRTVDLVENGRVCLSCEKPKNWDKFSKDAHGYNQKTSICTKCKNEKARKIYKENPESRRTGINSRPDKIMRLYGVTYEHIVHVLDMQFGRCANIGCGKEISLNVPNGKNRAVIDHCHNTGKFRALLCSKCNLTLGEIEKNGNRILGLMQYLTKHRQ